MGRLVAGVISLAVFICGAMYWSQAEQLQTMPQQPLCPGVTCADKTVTKIDNAAAVAPAAVKDEQCCQGKDGCAAAKDGVKKDCGACPSKDKAAVDA